MSVIGTTVVELARIKRRLDRKRRTTPPSRGLEFITTYAPGRSFADIGGMYGINGDIAFRAEQAGATAVTLFDAGEPTAAFRSRAEATGSKIRTVQGDLEDPQSVAEIGEHDVVWCAGVVYHTPHPLLQLLHLRQITREYLFLSSATIPEVPGFPQACVYYPYLEVEDRAALARGVEDPAMSIGLGTPFDDRPMYGHGNFWFGMTPSALRAMLRTARFEVIDEIRPDRYPWGVQYVARTIDKAPLMPPVGYYRERGEALRAGRTLPFDGYYDKGPDSVATGDDAFPDMAGLPQADTGAVTLPTDIAMSLLRRLRRSR